MNTDELLMEIQDTDELLYTQAESELMLDYVDAVKKVCPNGEEEENLRSELIERLQKLSQLILEYNERIDLTANNVTDPTKEELASLKRLFTTIEDTDFELTDKYQYLMERAKN